jgi:hypothetical protein
MLVENTQKDIGWLDLNAWLKAENTSHKKWWLKMHPHTVSLVGKNPKKFGWSFASGSLVGA